MSADPWQYIQSGDYSNAVEAYTSLIAHERKSPWFSNRGTAYLGLGQLEHALEDFQSALRLEQFPSDGYRQQIATVHWISGDHVAALDSWRSLVDDFSRGKIKFTDGSGGLHNACFLWFAGVTSDSPVDTAIATESMKKLLFNPRAKNWPGPVAAFILDQVDESTVRTYESDVDILRQRQACQTNFYAAIKAKRNNDAVRFAHLLRHAAQDGRAQIECEYHLARYEIERFNPAQNGV